MVVPNNHGFSYQKWSFWGVLGVPPFEETSISIHPSSLPIAPWAASWSRSSRNGDLNSAIEDPRAAGTTEEYHPPRTGPFYPKKFKALLLDGRFRNPIPNHRLDVKNEKKPFFLVGWTLPTSVNWWSLDFWTINSIMGLWRPLVVFLIITLSDAGFMYFLPWGWQP